MNALLLDAPGRLRPGAWPEEDLAPGRLRLRVQAVSLCGSDLHYYKEGQIGDAVAESPFVLGHEFSAVVNDERGEEFGMPPDTPEGPDVACRVVRIGGRVVLVGIPDGDRFALTASVARRKGLTVKFSRRMGHVYPRAIGLVAAGKVDLDALVTHHFPLEGGAEAFALQTERRDGAVKAVIEVGREG